MTTDAQRQGRNGTYCGLSCSAAPSIKARIVWDGLILRVVRSEPLGSEHDAGDEGTQVRRQVDISESRARAGHARVSVLMLTAVGLGVGVVGTNPGALDKGSEMESPCGARDTLSLVYQVLKMVLRLNGEEGRREEEALGCCRRSLAG